MERDAAVLLYGHSISGIIISLLTCTLFVFVFRESSIDSTKQIWWLSMVSLLTLRMVNVFWWKIKLQDTEYNGRKSILQFVFGVNCTAIMWALYLFYITNNSTDIELTTVIVSICAMAGGSATVLAGHKYTAMFYAFILLFPGSLSLLFYV